MYDIMKKVRVMSSRPTTPMPSTPLPSTPIMRLATPTPSKPKMSSRALPDVGGDDERWKSDGEISTLKSAMKHRSVAATKRIPIVQPVPVHANRRPGKKISIPLKQPQINLHWQLLPFGYIPGKPRVQFDVAFSTDNIRLHVVNQKARTLTSTELDKWAVNKDFTEMTIKCPKLPSWPVHVQRKEGIRCIDVYRAIYETFNHILTSRDLRQIPVGTIERCGPIFRRRCEATAKTKLPGYEESQGMRRVDLLNGSTIFVGLLLGRPNSDTHVASDECEWLLVLEYPRTT